MYKLVIAEKPSVAQSIAKVIGATNREDGYLEGNGYLVSWCVGHLVELAEPDRSDRFCNGIHHILTCTEMVGDFHQIVDLHRLERHRYLSCAVDLDDLFAG